MIPYLPTHVTSSSRVKFTSHFDPRCKKAEKAVAFNWWNVNPVPWAAKLRSEKPIGEKNITHHPTKNGGRNKKPNGSLFAQLRFAMFCSKNQEHIKKVPMVPLFAHLSSYSCVTWCMAITLRNWVVYETRLVASSFELIVGCLTFSSGDLRFAMFSLYT